MDKMTGIFTVRPFNPISRAICMANPESIFKRGPASHVITLDGNSGFAMEANMLKRRVQRITVEDALKGARVVSEVDYEVPDAERGLRWMRGECERKAGYDFGGAFGLGLAPDRNWHDPENWFCFEFHAMGMVMAGREIFRDCARVSAHMLLSVNPHLGQINGNLLAA